MRYFLTFLIILSSSVIFAQSTDIAQDFYLKNIPSFLNQTTSRIKQLDAQTNVAADNMLSKLQDEEGRIAKKVQSKDSVLHSQVFSNSAQFYGKLKSKLQTASDSNQLAEITEYIPYFDTLKGSLSFLSKQEEYLNNPQLKEAQQMLQQYQNRLQIANAIKLEIQQREQLLKAQLQNLGFVKEFTNINKQVYYYQQQLTEYKAAFKDPKKMEAKAIHLLSQTRFFKDFMKKNSVLASLFRLPDTDDPSNLIDIPGAQTVNSVQSILGQRFGSLTGAGSSMNPEQYMQQQLQSVQPQLTAIRDKLNKLGGGNSDMEMPEFKPDNQKTRSFLKRLEYGLNIQSQHGTGLLPVTTDIALTLGYKMSDKSAAGIGLAYKMGWGSDINHISISNQGVGFRSYFDAKVKGGIWASGGFEYNYMQSFQKWSDLNYVDVWQKSGLVGITKKYKISKRESKVQVLWDFLSYSQVPRSQPLKFRLGYNF